MPSRPDLREIASNVKDAFADMDRGCAARDPDLRDQGVRGRGAAADAGPPGRDPGRPEERVVRAAHHVAADPVRLPRARDVRGRWRTGRCAHRRRRPAAARATHAGCDARRDARRDDRYPTRGRGTASRGRPRGRDHARATAPHAGHRERRGRRSALRRAREPAGWRTAAGAWALGARPAQRRRRTGAERGCPAGRRGHARGRRRPPPMARTKPEGGDDASARFSLLELD